MTREIIAAALEAEGLKAGPQGISIPEDREATFYISGPGDLLPVGRVVRVELRDRYLHLLTGKDERYSFAYEDVLGLRTVGTGQGKERGAGFSR